MVVAVAMARRHGEAEVEPILAAQSLAQAFFVAHIRLHHRNGGGQGAPCTLRAARQRRHLETSFQERDGDREPKHAGGADHGDFLYRSHVAFVPRSHHQSSSAMAAVTVLAPIERNGSGGNGIERRLTNHSSVNSLERQSTRSRMMRTFICVMATPCPVQPME